MLFSCFVDFTKAFDSIWRSPLINKLHKIGINGLFLQIIKSIYNTTTNSLIYKGSLTSKFMSYVGVKQGDTLGTILFNLYINNLPEIFELDGNDPITIENTNLSCLKYADDLIIMSTSRDGLQRCLDNLAIYCEQWKLDLDTKNTKIVLFNRQGPVIKKHKFHYKLKEIEVVNDYKYLGFMRSMGSFYKRRC